MTTNVLTATVNRAQLIHEQINEAWNHVCHGFSATLLTLLVETRKRGLTDSEVKAYLQENESDNDYAFRAWRSGTGESFLGRSEGSFETVASVNELFQELDADDELQVDDSDLSVLPPADRIKQIALEAAEEQSHVYRIMHEMSEACPELGRGDIAGIVQEMIDAGTICIAEDQEDWLTFFRCVEEGEPCDTEAICFDALPAFTEAERRWDMYQGDPTEPEKHLLGIMVKIARSGVVLLSDLSEALRANGLTVDVVWPLLKMLTERHEIIFLRRIGTKELYIELQNVTVDQVKAHIALPELKRVLDLNQRVDEKPRAFVLSKSIAAIGEALSPDECTVLDAAQTLNGAFHQGGGVRVAMLNRVLQEYHNMERPVRNQILASLAERGILAMSVEDAAKIVRSVYRFRGQAGNESVADTPGVGSLIVPKIQSPPPTLRERCESLEYRQELSERFRLSGGDVCSVEAAMILTAASERAGVDQADFAKLYRHCLKNGLTDQTFKAGCEELSALDAIEIFRNRHSQLVVKLRHVVESAELLNVADMFSSLQVESAELPVAA